ncbi:MAG: glycosidase, partial [Chloroflexota bacterium]
MTISSSVAFTVERLGLLMAPAPEDPREVEGVLNPAGVVGPDGHYYLFPRCVGAGNYSRIGVARVLRDDQGRPNGVERLGMALEPIEPYEMAGPGMGGCEDPRVTYLACADLYVMAYTA